MKFKYILLILASSTADKLALTPENYFCVTPYLIKIMNTFLGYSTVIHFDHVSRIHFEKVLPNHMVYLFNYDNYTARNHPVGNNFMHVIDSEIIFKDSDYLEIQSMVS